MQRFSGKIRDFRPPEKTFAMALIQIALDLAAQFAMGFFGRIRCGVGRQPAQSRSMFLFKTEQNFSWQRICQPERDKISSAFTFDMRQITARVDSTTKRIGRFLRNTAARNSNLTRLRPGFGSPEFTAIEITDERFTGNLVAQTGLSAGQAELRLAGWQPANRVSFARVVLRTRLSFPTPADLPFGEPKLNLPSPESWVPRCFQWNRKRCVHGWPARVCFNPKGIVSSSPRLARLGEGLPWVVIGRDLNPERVEYQSLDRFHKTCNVLLATCEPGIFRARRSPHAPLVSQPCRLPVGDPADKPFCATTTARFDLAWHPLFRHFLLQIGAPKLNLPSPESCALKCWG
jgi:hypothetical protein